MISSPGRGWRLLFLVFVLIACGPKADEPVSIVWVNEKATALIIRHLDASATDLSALEVQLIGADERAPVLGSFKLSGDEVTFTPLVPLTNGLTYELLEDGKPFGDITIPISDALAPEIVGVFPRVDTVPENLLKVHIQFSQPMMEGKSGQFVKLIENGKDTLEGTFLDLQPELWDEAGTTLTLWLDPGRIKLDLIPNKELGNPLTRGAQCSLVILPGWRSKDGVPLASATIRSILVGGRDDQSPNVEKWRLEIPTSATRKPLDVQFAEPLDWLLANECIRVLDASGKAIPGSYKVNEDASRIAFVPESGWKAGSYSITVEARLEDLAGNNLNRLFEEDLTSGIRKEAKASYERKFVVR